MLEKIRSFFKKNRIDEDYYEDEYPYDNMGIMEEIGKEGEDMPDEMSLPIRQSIDYNDKEERLCYIRDCCEQIITADKNLEEVKAEYALVTGYLSDMRRFEELPRNRKKDIVGLASNVYKYMSDKEKRLNGSKKTISPKYVSIIEPYEDVMPEEIKKLTEYEDYKLVIENDMRKLEGERGSIIYERKSIEKWQEFLKFMMTVVLTFVVLLSCLFICVYKITGSDMMVPFLCMIALAAFAAFYAGIEGINNKKKAKINAGQMNRLVELVNKTKIKYANNKSVVDYMHAKYDVKNSMELKYIWEQYIGKQRADKEFKRNMGLLDSYSNSLMLEFEKIGISDPRTWLNQTDAIIDPKKMDEIKKRLEVRMDKLRQRIDYNNKLIDMGMDDIRKVIDKNSEYKIEVVAILKRYGIDLD